MESTHFFIAQNYAHPVFMYSSALLYIEFRTSISTTSKVCFDVYAPILVFIHFLYSYY